MSSRPHMAKLKLHLFVVYEFPKDFPSERFVCRKWIAEGDGIPTDEVITGQSLAQITTELESRGLISIGRFPSDDPCIKDVWI